MSGSLRIGLLLVGSSAIGAIAALPNWNEPTRLTFISVGQGDCAVFQTSGHTILIDTGPNAPGNDAGKRIVVPDLRKMGIDSIDLILLSHPDTDHIGGLAEILRREKVGRICISSAFMRFEPLLDRLKEENCPSDLITWLGPAQSAKIGDFNVEIDCPEWHEGEPDNDGSEFVKISGDGATAVFTGDASSKAEDKMMLGHDWSAQVLKLGHHGSRSASSDEFLRAVHPKWAIVSCGRNNSYGHPHHDVLERVDRLGIQLARTDREGDIVFDLGSKGWTRVR